jgi:MORN repeat
VAISFSRLVALWIIYNTFRLACLGSWLMASQLRVSPHLLFAVVAWLELLPACALAFQLDDENPSSAGLSLNRLTSALESVTDWAQDSIRSIGRTKTTPRPGECEKGAAPGCGYAAYQWFGSRPDEHYEGEYSDGAPNGHGIASWSDGSRYEGEFRSGKFQGGVDPVRPDTRRVELRA